MYNPSERIIDIIKEMRERFKQYAMSNSTVVRYVAFIGNGDAERIERAYFREVVGKLDTGAFSEEQKQTVTNRNHYNGAKVYEALKCIVSVCADWDVTDCQAREIAEDLAREVLVAPPRNCDKCNTADDAVELAVDAGVVDCNFGAREMAEFLLGEAEGGAE